jgi:uncharacterized damage-inducible protein DinB
MTIADLRTLLDYHYWALGRVLDAVDGLSHEQYTRELGGSFRSMRDTLVHTYAAERVWHSRWLGRSPSSLAGPEALPTAGDLRTEWRALEAEMRALLAEASQRDVTRTFEYTLLSGLRGTSTFAEMVQHVVNHASYHRGQVTTLLRQLGASPPKGTDLILFFRERQAAAG